MRCQEFFEKYLEEFLMSIFADRLRECRKNICKTQRDIADDLGLTERGYQNYELGNREPKIETLNKIADYFDVSIDYLTGRDDIPKRK